MKTSMHTLVLALSTFLSVSPALAGNDPTGLKVDATKSQATWTGKKVTGSHYGKVSFTEGEVHIQNNKIVDARVVVDMTSITVEDLTDADYNAKLTGHLKSADFFDVENYKQATVSVKKVTDIKEDADGNNVMIEGDLTIKGQTHPVSFPANVSVTSGKVVARGDFKFDRTQYGIRYGSGSFFDNLGDKTIDDMVEISFVLIAGK